MTAAHKITETVRLSSKGRMNFARLLQGYHVGKEQLRHLVAKGAATADGKPVPEVARAFAERFA